MQLAVASGELISRTLHEHEAVRVGDGITRLRAA
jgi:hypothetical protein